MEDYPIDVFDLSYLASQFHAAVERKARAEPSLADAFRKAATQHEMDEMLRISEILFKPVSYMEGGADDEVQAPRAALLVQLVDYYAAIALRVMKEEDARALVPPGGHSQAVSDGFAGYKAQSLARLFKPS